MDKKYEGKAQRGADQTIKLLKRLPEGFIAGRRIMDIGANVGLVSAWLETAGARSVTGYEPHPKAFAAANERRSSVVTFVEAALLTEAGEFALSESTTDADADYHCNATIVAESAHRPANRHFTRVIAERFDAELLRVRPEGIKLDTEGSEYDILLRNKINPECGWMCIEFHWLNGVGAWLFAAALRSLARQGFYPQALSPGLIQPDGTVKTFWGFEVVNFLGEPPTQEVLEAMNRLYAKAAEVKRNGLRILDPRRAALFQEFV